jgi:glyoxylase-like metal-dependent hydrolase (beta-lactamase superfamily II)
MRHRSALSLLAFVTLGVGSAEGDTGAFTRRAEPIGVSPAPADSLRVFDLQRLADGVYAALVVDRPDAYAFANSLVVIGNDGVLVVDTQQSPQAAVELIRLVRRLSPLPVRWVVNTHWHGDHVYGNIAYRDAFPGARFLAHPSTVIGMREGGADQRAEELATLPATIEARERWLDEGVLPDGRELTTALREEVLYSLELRRSYFSALRDLVVVEPEGTVDARRRLDLGGRIVELLPLGPAHTAGDLGVWVPDSGVMAVGDLLEEAPPWIDGAASLAGWADALDRISEEGASIFLPSHGTVQLNPTLLVSERALFRELTELSARAVEESWPPDRIVDQISLEAHRAFLMGLGLDEEGFLDWRGRAIATALEQAGAPRR